MLGILFIIFTTLVHNIWSSILLDHSSSPYRIARGRKQGVFPVYFNHLAKYKWLCARGIELASTRIYLFLSAAFHVDSSLLTLPPLIISHSDTFCFGTAFQNLPTPPLCQILRTVTSILVILEIVLSFAISKPFRFHMFFCFYPHR